MSGQSRGPGPALSRLMLQAMAQLYLLGLKLNLGIYANGLKTCTHPVLPTISVGNLALGGTGKTTVVRFLAELLVECGLMPGIVLRGYGRSGGDAPALVADGERMLASVSRAGDEAYLLGQVLATVPVAVGKRRESAIRLLAERTGAQIALLDDGFQYFRMSKLCDIVLLDASVSLRGERLFPAGHLREPLSHLRRADQIWITHADEAHPEQLADLRGILTAMVPEIPVLVTRHRLAALELLSGGAMNPTDLVGKRVLAVSGIGNPRSFETSLEQAGVQVVPWRYPDHHRYCSADLQKVAQTAQVQQVDLIACTRKDAVKWPQMPGPLPAVVVDCQLQILEGKGKVNYLIDEARQAVAAAQP